MLVISLAGNAKHLLQLGILENQNTGNPSLLPPQNFEGGMAKKTWKEFVFPKLLLLPDKDVKFLAKAGMWLSATHSNSSLVSKSDLFELWSVGFNFQAVYCTKYS